jgi:hypothetical protein
VLLAPPLVPSQSWPRLSSPQHCTLSGHEQGASAICTSNDLPGNVTYMHQLTALVQSRLAQEE